MSNLGDRFMNAFRCWLNGKKDVRIAHTIAMAMIIGDIFSDLTNNVKLEVL